MRARGGHSFDKLPLLTRRSDVERTAVERTDRIWGRALKRGLAFAIVLHLLIFVLFRTTRVPPPAPFSAAGPPMGDVRAAAGGSSGLTMIEIREQTPAAVPEPVPEVVPEPREVVVEPVQEPSEPADPGPTSPQTAPGRGESGTGGETGEAKGPGTATGEGAGGGGTEEEGRSDLIAPRPRGMILPPSDRPRSARGQEITVWVFVTDRGRVVSDSTRLEPPTADNRYNERLRRSASEWVFDPARRNGRPVAAWYPYQIIL